MTRLTSRRNPVVARYKDAALGAPGALLLDGVHLVTEALAANATLHHAIVSSEALDRGEIRTLVERLERAGLEVAAGSATVMAAVSPVRSPSPVVALGDRPVHDAVRLFAGSAPLVVIAVDVQDPGNLGAIVRASEAAGASGLIAAGHSADPFGWKALRGSMGSALRLPVVIEPEMERALENARDRRCAVVATVPRGGTQLFEADLRSGVAVLIGAEGRGLPQGLVDSADRRLSIPMSFPVDSLNAAVTAAVILYEAMRQRLQSGAGVLGARVPGAKVPGARVPGQGGRPR
jgi:TrmH family RNA methyltransferase